MTFEICLGDILVNGLAFLAVAFASCLLWLMLRDVFRKRQRRRQRQPREG